MPKTQRSTSSTSLLSNIRRRMRRDDWYQHFALQGGDIVGKTPTGRATVRLLRFNTPRRVELRDGLIAEGEF